MQEVEWPRSAKFNYYLNIKSPSFNFDGDFFLLDYSFDSLGLMIQLAYEVELLDGESQLKRLCLVKCENEQVAALFHVLAKLSVGKLIEAQERLSPKEIDYFLRDHPTRPILPYYPRYILELIGILEAIRRKINAKEGPKAGPMKQLFKIEDFKSLSYASQLNIIEEILSAGGYDLIAREGVKLIESDVSFDQIFLKLNKRASSKCKEQLKELFSFHLQQLINLEISD